MQFNIKKVAKLVLLTSFLYEEFKFLCTSLQQVVIEMWRGELEFKGAILLNTNTDIKPKLIEQLNQQQCKFLIYGDGKNEITLNKLEIPTNNIYLYSYNIRTSELEDILVRTNEITQLMTSLKIPFYMKWLSFSRLHFELFGSGFSLCEQSIPLLPVGSTLITTSAAGYSSLHSINDELILKAFHSYVDNPYIRFVKYIIINPEDNAFIIKTYSELKTFKSTIDQLINFSDKEIVIWQREKVDNFIHFFKKLHLILDDKMENEFEQFIKHSLTEVVSTLQEAYLSRYKELLLFYYIVKGDKEKVEVLLNKGVSITTTLLNGATPLYLSAHLGNKPTTKLLIDLQAPIDEARYSKVTPLMAASLNNHWEIVELLLNAGADANAIDINGNTALILSSFKENEKVAELLIKFGADVNLNNKAGESGLTLASSKGNINIVKHLLNQGANIEFVNQNSYTSLMLAIFNKHKDVTALLIKYGAEINAQTNERVSSIFLAVSNIDTEIVEMLLDHGANINLVNNGRNLISLAIIRENLDILKLLLSYAPNLNTSPYDHDITIYTNNDSIKKEVREFENNPINYVLRNNHNAPKAIKALNNIELNIIPIQQNIELLCQIKNCLLDLDQIKVYDDLTNFCYI